MKHISLAFIFMLVAAALAQAPALEQEQNGYSRIPTCYDTLESLRAEVVSHPDSAEAHFNLARACLVEIHYPEAREHLEQAIRLKPDYAEAYFFLGIAYSDLFRPQEEIAAYRRAVQIKPDYPEAYSDLGMTYDELGRYGEAIEFYKLAARTSYYRDNGHDYLYLAQDYLRLGRYKDARRAVRIALRKTPPLANTKLWNHPGMMTPGLDPTLLLSLVKSVKP